MPRLDLVGVIVGDMARSVDFYRRLGLEFPDGAENEGHVEARAGTMRVGLDTEDVVRSFDPDWTRPTGGNALGLAFLCDSPTDVDRLHDELVGAGYASHKEPWDAFWGQRYAQVRDPDGNSVDLFAPLG
jgi:catechol 2,3-dioxygenase-like lactoylglutathione lyase family enzyme